MRKLGGAVRTVKIIGTGGYRRGIKTPEFISMAFTVGISQFWRFTKGDRGWMKAAQAGVTSGVASIIGFGLVNAAACLVYNRDNIRSTYEVDNDEEMYNEE